MVFSLDGKSDYRTEIVAPYSLAGDTDGDYNDWTPSVGTHTLTATPYNSQGQVGTPLTITFDVVASPPVDGGDPDDGTGAVVVQGELKKWHKVTLTVNGPASSEGAPNNPFLNYRLNVTFTNGAINYQVPGYFSADGNAGETSADAGSTWKVHFAPDEAGTWTYRISMRAGANVAISDDPSAGVPVELVDGKTGTFVVSATDKSGVDLRGKGRLRYVGERYLQFAEKGDYFLKAGVDSPENFLAYADFDNTPNIGNRRKSWGPHVQDWRPGDPTWKGDKGKGIIGAINYLSGQGLNVFSFLTMNIQGDDQNVYPYVSTSDFARFDCSKLDQWETVFEHADRMGMYVHVKMQETENDRLLDGGNLGVLRKLYYRELIARFSHHLALNWNVGEENLQTTAQRKECAAYLYSHDPYQHHIVIHTYPSVKDHDEVYTPLLGGSSNYSGASIQTVWNRVYEDTRKWVEKSAQAGKKWVVANDEQGGSEVGVAADAGYSGNRGTVADNQNDIRKDVLWGNLMASGAGVEYYFGYATGETDLSAQDFRSRATMWRYSRYALDFFEKYVSVPLPDLSPLNQVSNGWLLGKDGKLYVIYLKNGGSTNLTINTGGNYSVQWYDPRNGGDLQNGSVTKVSGNGTKSIGNPPNSATQDWVVLVRTESQTETGQQSVYRINAGGGSYTMPDGTAFSADAFSSGGNVYVQNNPSDIDKTLSDNIYHSERYGNFSYNFPVSTNGEYKVILHFAEIFTNGIGRRRFNVDIEGQRKLSEFDITAEAGKELTALQKTFTVTVTDNMLTVNFVKGSVEWPKVSGLEVMPVTPTTAGARPGNVDALLSDNEVAISTYPNPVSESVTIDGVDSQRADLAISITSGLRDYPLKHVATSSHTVQVTLPDLTEGLYIMRVQQGSKSYTKKIIVKR
ncbi:malectin domain-containing carbohydrate-binding protein [Spirosoma fluviale]|uniref:malectin domain-containing carbohydrate-binding protein n=1 Tax=Spirosoma fluviale TaxID=1597977 RepID=UPI001C53D99F|nr:malectin domain-containing carbohydrate-binding protein [Spirosoma fluviale]